MTRRRLEHAKSPRQMITGIVLAGGQGRRMGGIDKGFALLNGRPLVEYVLSTITPQVSHIVISANRNISRYRKYGWPVISDQAGGYPGPLGGISSALSHITSEWALVVPCDVPYLPVDLADRLWAGSKGSPNAIACAHDGVQLQPVCMLLSTAAIEPLNDYLIAGGRKVGDFLRKQAAVEVDFSDCPESFFNVNTLADIEAAEKSIEPKQSAVVGRPHTMSKSDANSIRGHGHDSPAISHEQALKTILERLTPIRDQEQIALQDALGRALAEDVHSPINVPGHTNSAMDGYCFRHSDLPAAGPINLQIVGDSFAGHPFKGGLGTREAVRIMTGGVLPAEADTVIMQEQVVAQDHAISFSKAPQKGANVRHAGEDIGRGARVLPAGRRIGPAEAGLLASVGMAQIKVIRRPVITFLSTGDEIKPVGEPLMEGQIHDSNRYTLRGLLLQRAVSVQDGGIVPDQPEALRESLTKASRSSDLLITTGGVSVGAADHITKLLGEIGEVGFWQIAVKPGRPLAFGRIGQAWFFGLPGNPVSVMVSYLQLVRHAIDRLEGIPYSPPLQFHAKCKSRLSKKPGRMEFQRGRLQPQADGTLEVVSTGAQGSGILTSMSNADCFIILPQDSDGAQPGDWVKVEPFNVSI